MISIESATEDDLRAIAEVHSKAVRAAYLAVIPPELFDPEYVAPEKMEMEYRAFFGDFGPRDRLLKAVSDGKVIGICACGEDTELNEEGTGYLQRVYVDPEWWGRGIGSALVDRAMELLANHGFRKAALHVLENNSKARAFYEKRGWQYQQVAEVKVIGKELRYVRSLSDHT